MDFQDRRDAGRRVAAALDKWADEDVVVLGLARGGMPVAAEVAAALRAPLDVLVVRKVGAPLNPEYGIGAVSEGGVVWLNETAVSQLGVGRDEIDSRVERERQELDRRVARYRGQRPPTEVEGRTAIVVDDGLATGVSATAAVAALRERGVQRVVLAVPVGAPDSVERLRGHADEVVCLHTPPTFRAVGAFYRDFGQTTDDDVAELLAGASM